jgi:hypothetical protein
MIFIRFFLLLLFLYLVVRMVARLLVRVLGIRWLFSSSGSRQVPPKSRESSGAVDAEFEVIESHIRDDA